MKEITLVECISESCVVTAGLDKYVKIWSIEYTTSAAKAKLLAQFKVENELCQISYNSFTKVLAFFDKQGTLGTLHLSEESL